MSRARPGLENPDFLQGNLHGVDVFEQAQPAARQDRHDA